MRTVPAHVVQIISNFPVGSGVRQHAVPDGLYRLVDRSVAVQLKCDRPLVALKAARMFLPLAHGLLAMHMLSAVADGVPNIDIEKTCRVAAGTGIAPTRTDIDACLADEQGAREQLVKEWVQFSAADKARCVQAARTAYLPSYVEWLSCLEMARDAKKLPEEQTTPAMRRQRK